ncbi:MAG: hypothetical protein IBX50_08205 [Marinospirillum sp.]|uniref:hypothetical protein n=1 Tax=Marinospirillum sp. TaxID=2183934 RepID=UPI001A09B2EE|nr:hypothetical protein [Marinospirillum sp.]MBE0506688.1 hypothetical protein [Marinospirillum sp.]
MSILHLFSFFDCGNNSGCHDPKIIAALDERLTTPEIYISVIPSSHPSAAHADLTASIRAGYMCASTIISAVLIRGIDCMEVALVTLFVCSQCLFFSAHYRCIKIVMNFL